MHLQHQNVTSNCCLALHRSTARQRHIWPALSNTAWLSVRCNHSFTMHLAHTEHQTSSMLAASRGVCTKNHCSSGGLSMFRACTAGVVIFMSSVTEIDWLDITEALPAFVTVVSMPMTNNSKWRSPHMPQPVISWLCSCADCCMARESVVTPYACCSIGCCSSASI